MVSFLFSFPWRVRFTALQGAFLLPSFVSPYVFTPHVALLCYVLQRSVHVLYGSVQLRARRCRMPGRQVRGTVTVTTAKLVLRVDHRMP
jgi:hypothetical protein